MIVTRVPVMQNLLTNPDLFLPASSDCLQTLAVFPVLPGHADALQQQDPMQTILLRGPAEMSIHIT